MTHDERSLALLMVAIAPLSVGVGLFVFCLILGWLERRKQRRAWRARQARRGGSRG